MWDEFLLAVIAKAEDEQLEFAARTAFHLPDRGKNVKVASIRGGVVVGGIRNDNGLMLMTMRPDCWRHRRSGAWTLHCWAGCGVGEMPWDGKEDQGRVGKCARTTSIAVPSTSRRLVAVGRANR